MHDKKYQNIIKLDNAERYNYLIRKVADFEIIYLIYGRFWQISTTSINGIECILVFPEKEFAKKYVGSDKSKIVKKKDLYKFIDWLGKDKPDQLNFAIFPNQNNEAKVVHSAELKHDLLEECSQYE